MVVNDHIELYIYVYDEGVHGKRERKLDEPSWDDSQGTENN